MIKRIYSCMRRELQLSAQPEDLKGSAVECADQNCGFCKDLNKMQFCGHSPYIGGEPCYIWCCGSFVLSFVMIFHTLIYIYLISKITAKILTSL